MASSHMSFDTRRMSRSPDCLLGDRDERDHEGAMPTSGPRGGSGDRHKDHKRWSRSRSRSPRSPRPYKIIKSPNNRRDKVRRKRSCLSSSSGSRSPESSGMEGGRRERPRRHVFSPSFHCFIFTFSRRERGMHCLAHNGENTGLSVTLSTSSIRLIPQA